MPFPEIINWTMPGVGFPKASDFETMALDVPVKLGLLGAYFTTEYTADALYNYADPTKPLKKIGSPQLDGPYAVCNAQNCFDTGIPSQNEMSVISIALRSDTAVSTGQGMVVSNYDGVGGDSLRLTDTSVVANAWVTAGLTNAITPIVNIPNTDFVIATGQFNPGRSVSGFYDPTAKNIVSKSSLGAGRQVQSNTLLIGGHRGAGQFTGWAHVSVVLVFNRLLTVDEYKSICLYLRFTFGPQFLIW
ncbi:hypothetical protein [Serratia marcescens]|uniref:hypothetical protein n=1 Tax=Serratia marcescens TaxID=615 RepID=UPI003982E397